MRRSVIIVRLMLVLTVVSGFNVHEIYHEHFVHSYYDVIELVMMVLVLHYQHYDVM